MSLRRTVVSWVSGGSVALFVTAGLFLWHLDYVGQTAGHYRGPIYDEFLVVNLFVQEDSPTLSALMRPHGEHRLPLPRFLVTWSAKLSGEFLVGRYLCVVAMALAALGFLVAVRRLRGRLALQDVTIPLLMMSPAGWFSTIHGFGLHYLVPTALVAMAMALAAREQFAGSIRSFLALLLLISLLILCGINGILMGLALTPILFVSLPGRWPACTRNVVAGAATTTLVAGAIAMVSGDMWFRGADGVEEHILTALEFAAVGWGAGFNATRLLWGFLSAAVISAALILLLRRIAANTRRVRDGIELRLLCPLLGYLVLVVGVGFGRSGGGHEGYIDRYVLLSAPGLVFAYLAFASVSARSEARPIGLWLSAQVLPWIMLTALFVTIPVYVHRAREAQTRLRMLTEHFLFDVAGPEPLPVVFERYGQEFYPITNHASERWFPLLHEHRMAPFAASRAAFKDHPRPAH